jgi:hypothetical protein
VDSKPKMWILKAKIVFMLLRGLRGRLLLHILQYYYMNGTKKTYRIIGPAFFDSFSPLKNDPHAWL